MPDITAADLSIWETVHRAIADEAHRLCREACKDEGCRTCGAHRHPDWRRDALASLRKAALQPAEPGAETISSIQIGFAATVHIRDGLYHALVDVIDRICKDYEARHPDRIMWTCGFGGKITYMPMTREEEAERGMEFDMSVLSIECAERERYETDRRPKSDA